MFDQCFAIVVGEEGGYCDTPGDPGGATKFGISHAAYPTLDIANLTLAEAKAIIKRDYWNKISGDVLPPRLALLVFDAAVNNGVERAIRWLQEALGVSTDGSVGLLTLHAAFAQDTPTVCAEFQAQRLLFMTELPTWRIFGLGWARRLCSLPWKAQQLAGEPAATQELT